MAVKLLDHGDFVIIQIADLSDTVELDVANGPCRLHSFDVSGLITADGYIKFWDDINPAHGTTEPVECHDIALADDGTENSNQSTPIHPGTGLKFSKGLSIASSDTGGKGANAAAAGTVKVTLLVERI